MGTEPGVHKLYRKAVLTEDGYYVIRVETKESRVCEEIRKLNKISRKIIGI